MSAIPRTMRGHSHIAIIFYGQNDITVLTQSFALDKTEDVLDRHSENRIKSEMTSNLRFQYVPKAIEQLLFLLTFVVLLQSLFPVSAYAATEQEIADAVLARLSPPEQRKFKAYRAARKRFDTAQNVYWARVKAKRKVRSKKWRAKKVLMPRDYILKFPPKYNGPRLSSKIKKIWAQERKMLSPAVKPAAKKPEIPSVRDFLANAKKYYGFEPERVSETSFKRRYALEALKLGLRKDQVVRVYALETGGRGTFDMQAGIHPIKRTGRPISTALGYAQLLSANSISQLVKHGGKFVRRLEALSRSNTISPARRDRLRKKIRAIQAMRRVARSVKNDWYVHRRLARTPRGMGIHALNIDGDVGPWLQVIKLNGIRELAAKWGMRNLTGAELEIMNLAGPRTGFEMMQPLVWDAPSSNFFSRRAYYRNSVVRGRTARQLMLELDKRIDAAMKNKGAVRFEQAFDWAKKNSRVR